MANQVEKTVTRPSYLEKAVQFLKEVRGEVAKVTWPSGDEVKSATTVVIIVCIFVAFVIWGIDKVISYGMDVIFRT